MIIDLRDLFRRSHTVCAHDLLENDLDHHTSLALSGKSSSFRLPNRLG